jgi:hypothetical protein
MARADFHLVNGTDEFEQQFRSLMRRLAEVSIPLAHVR